MPKNLDLTEKLEKYILNHSEDLHPVQKEIIEHNNKLGDIKRMQISISQAQFLQLLIKITGVKKILEFGTFTGFSTLSMGLALPNDSKIVTIDKNIKIYDVAENFFKKANMISKIHQMPMEALDAINILEEDKYICDLVFIDADKENYKIYYEKSLNFLKSAGLIIIDNVLWYGEVSNSKKNDNLTNIIREFNTFVKKDKRTEKIILPLGDGLTICRKL